MAQFKHWSGGQNFADNVSQALSSLADVKANFLQRQALESYGMTPEKAKGFSYLPPETQKQLMAAQIQQDYLSKLFGGGQQAQEVTPQEETPAPLQHVMQQMAPQQVQAQQNPIMAALAQMQPQQLPGGLPDRRQEAFMNALRGHVEQQQLAPQQQQEAPNPAVLAQIAEQQATPKAPMPRRTGPTAEQLRAAALGAPNPQMANQLEKMAKSMETRQLQQEKMSAKERQEQRADIRENKKLQFQVDKLTKPDYDQIIKEASAAKEDSRRLGRMKELVHKGNLSSPALGSLFKTISDGIWGFGVDLKFLQSADSQEFNKLSKDFIKNAKPLFGARVTDNELKTFLETVPDLAQSSEGILRIIHNMELANEAKYVKKEAAKAILKENNGHRPLDFLAQVDERSNEKLNALAQEFVKGIQQEKTLKREPRGFLRDIGGIVKRSVGIEK